MKLVCEREKLLDALKVVAPRAKPKHTIPILRFARLRAEVPRLSIGATDLTMWGESSLAADISVAGDCAASADQLMRLVAGFPVGAQVKIESDDKVLTLSCGRSTYRLETLPASDWPECPEVEQAERFSLGAEAARRLFDPPGEAIEDLKGARPYLEGGYLHQDAPGEISIIGTNSIRLVRIVSPCDFTLNTGRIIPMDAMREIVKLAKEELQFSVGSNLIEARGTSLIFRSKLLDFSYPDFRKIIPEASGPSFIVDRADFTAALHRLTVLAADNTNYRIAWKAGASEIAISLRGNGTGQERVAATINHPEDGQIGFAPSNLNAALGVFTGEELEFFGGPGVGCRVVDHTTKDLTVAVGQIQLGAA